MPSSEAVRVSAEAITRIEKVAMNAERDRADK